MRPLTRTARPPGSAVTLIPRAQRTGSRGRRSLLSPELWQRAPLSSPSRSRTTHWAPAVSRHWRRWCALPAQSRTFACPTATLAPPAEPGSQRRWRSAAARCSASTCSGTTWARGARARWPPLWRRARRRPCERLTYHSMAWTTRRPSPWPACSGTRCVAGASTTPHCRSPFPPPQSLTRLDLSSNRLGPASAEAVAAELPQTRALRSLRVRGCGCGFSSPFTALTARTADRAQPPHHSGRLCPVPRPAGQRLPHAPRAGGRVRGGRRAGGA